MDLVLIVKWTTSVVEVHTSIICNQRGDDIEDKCRSLAEEHYVHTLIAVGKSCASKIGRFSTRTCQLTFLREKKPTTLVRSARIE
jgi:hypothetical protein